MKDGPAGIEISPKCCQKDAAQPCFAVDEQGLSELWLDTTCALYDKF